MSELKELSSSEKGEMKPLYTYTPNIWDSLSVKKKVFALAYAKTGSVKEAASEANVSYSCGSIWKKDFAVAALINKHIEEFKEQTKTELITSSLMIERAALDVLDIALANEDTYSVDKEGNTVVAPVTNLTAANQALSTLSKLHSDVEKIKVEKEKGPNQVVVNIEQANFDSDQAYQLFNGQVKEQHEVLEGDYSVG